MENNDIVFKTPYEWCVEANVRLLDINDWPLEWYGSKERHYFEFPTMPKSEFLDALAQCRVKPNSTPRKTEQYLTYRMYGLVPYNLSPIQQGIQFGHAVVEYSQSIKHEQGLTIYNKWANNDKTFIILNGGTTNNTPERLGTLNKHLEAIKNAGVYVAEFYEPDLGDQLTAFCFLVDERVFDKETYPDFVPETLPWSRKPASLFVISDLEKRNAENYQRWVDKIGGEKNAFLRTYLRQFKLA